MKQSGTTLPELLVVLAVSSILMALAFPGLVWLASSSRLTSATNALVSSLYLTRSEAIKRRSRAVMCPSKTGTSCAASGGWHQGWIVFGDANNNAAVDAGETVILHQQGMAEGFQLTGNAPVSKYISYTAMGAAKRVSGAFQAGTLTVCRQSSEQGQARQIVISSTGRPRTAKITLTSCP